MSRSVLSRALTVALIAAIVWMIGYRRRSIAPGAQATSSPGAHATGSLGPQATTSRESHEPGPTTPESSAAAPESVVWRMVEASRAGDPVRYLDCYTGEMETRLLRDFEDMGPVRSRDYLLTAHQQLKGVAVRSPRMSSPIEAQIPVEYVYEDRNEVQQVYVRNVSGLWKIDRVEGAERVKTLVPYGAPVER